MVPAPPQQPRATRTVLAWFIPAAIVFSIASALIGLPARREAAFVPEGALLLQNGYRVELLREGHPRRVLGDGLFAEGMSPDGKHILVRPINLDPAPGPRRVDKLLALNVTTGTRSLIVSRDPSQLLGIGMARWSPDGESVAYAEACCPTALDGDPPKRLCVIRLRVKRESCVPKQGLHFSGSFDWFPDGKRLLVGTDSLIAIDARKGDISVLVPPGGDSELKSELRRRGLGRVAQFSDVSVSPSGKYFAAITHLGGGKRFAVPIVFRSDGTLVAVLKDSGDYPSPRAWSANDVFAYTRGEAPYRVTEAYGFDPRTSRTIWRSIRSGPAERRCTSCGTVQGVVWSPTGRWLAVLRFGPSSERWEDLLTIIDIHRRSVDREMRIELDGVEPLKDWGP